MSTIYFKQCRVGHDPSYAGLLGRRAPDTDLPGIGKRDCVRSMADGLKSGAVSAVEPAL